MMSEGKGLGSGKKRSRKGSWMAKQNLLTMGYVRASHLVKTAQRLDKEGKGLMARLVRSCAAHILAELPGMK